MSRNVVHVTVDSLRSDHCGFLGYEGDTTPNLDGIAADGITFENAIAPGSNTPSSMPAIFTGEEIPGVEYGVARREAIRRHVARHQTIQERLSRRGYHTIAFTSNPFTSRYFGFDDGFDEFNDFLSSERTLTNRIVSRWMAGESVAGLRFGANMLGYGDLSTTWEDFYDELLESVAATDEPFYLWVFLLEPHWPYQPPPRFREAVSLLETYYYNWVRSKLSNATPSESGVEALRSLYDGTIRHVDEFVERVTSDLAAADPVWIFHSDHGEAFGEHGTYGHGEYLYEENIRVPLLLWNADGPTADRVRDPVSLCSLPDMIDDVSDGTESVDAWKYTRPWLTVDALEQSAVRGRQWKFLRERRQGTFYDLRTDPAEQSGCEDHALSDLCHRIIDTRSGQRAERKRVEHAITKLDRQSL
jgi:arylsulfatase